MNQVLSTMEHSTALSKNNKKLPETFYMPLIAFELFPVE